MTYPSILPLNKLTFKDIPSSQLPLYAYALTCCQYAASVVSGKWHRAIDSLCGLKIAELQEEISRRGDRGEPVNETDKLASGKLTLTQMSVAELIEAHSMSNYWQDWRRSMKMEPLTRSLQWRIVNELNSRKESGKLGPILRLAEIIETDNYARILGLPYSIDAEVKTFTATEYGSDEDLICHIQALSQTADYTSREELIQIADYIQTEIVERGEAQRHLPLINAILCTGMLQFHYPQIVLAFEKAVKSQEKEQNQIDLAQYFYRLWELTQKPTYLSRFENTLRQCYLTLAADKTYPHLGLNKKDSRSLSAALQLLDHYRKNVWILNDKYNVDKLLAKYQSA